MSVNFSGVPDPGSDPTQAPNAAPIVPPTNTPVVPPNQPQPPVQKQPNPYDNIPPQQSLPATLFHKAFGMITSGQSRPVYNAQGQPVTNEDGTVQMKPAGAKVLGASILSGAIAGMMAGWAAPTQRTQIGPHRSIQEYGPSVAAGAAAAQPYTTKGSQDAAQKQADENQTRAFATTDHNLKLHAAMLGNLKLQGDIMHEGVQQDAPLIDAMKLNPTITDKDGKVLSMIKGEHVSETDLQKMMADGGANVTRDSVLRDGVQNVYDAKTGKQVFNPDGTPRQEYTYTVYDHNAQVALTQDLKKDFSALQYVLPGTSVSMSVLGKYNLERTTTKNAQSFVNQWAKQVAEFNGDAKVKPIDLKAATAKDPYLQKLVPQLGRYAGMEPDLALAQMDKDGVDPTLIGKFNELLGGVDRNKWAINRQEQTLEKKNEEAEKKAQELADLKRQTPEGQIDLKLKQQELSDKQQAAAQMQAASKGIPVPKGFLAIPNAVALDSGTLGKTLTAKGVEIPSNFNALYTIAHNDASLSTLPNNPRPKTGEMSRDHALDFIRTFINPQYQEGDYAANANLQKELRSTRVGVAGGTLLAAGTASRHMEMLLEASNAMHNGNVQALNAIKAAYNVATGDPDPVVFKAITQKLNEEIEKVTSGGVPMEASLKQASDNLSVSHSPDQVKGVLKGYLGLMNGRIGEIDDRSYQYTGRHIPVSASLAKVFNSQGFTIPGQPAGTVPITRNGEVIGFSADGGHTMIPAPPPVR